MIALFIAASCCSYASPTGPSGSAIRGDWSGVKFGNTCCVYWNVRIVVEAGQLTGKACLTAAVGPVQLLGSYRGVAMLEESEKQAAA